MSDYQVRFEVFEGPLDLLLHLIRKEEVDIYQVNLTKIATEFVAHLDVMRELDLDIAGEFLVMAATLMLIKSRELLPADQRPAPAAEEDDDLDDPRRELIRQLVEYKKFKDAAARLHEHEVRAENTFPRLPGRFEPPAEAAPRRGADASIFDLLGAVNAVLKRFQERQGDQRDVFADRWTVSEKIQHIMAALAAQGPLRFSELFEPATNRAEVVVTFLALLELIRLRQVLAHQPEQFAEILLEAAPAAPPPDAPAAGPEEAAAPPPAPETPGPRWN
jgi:segregation and condensation protein A